MEQESTGLRPCPFCKCPVTLFVSIYGIHGANDYYALAHPDGTDCIIDGMVTSSYSDKDELIRDWNRGAELSEADILAIVNGWLDCERFMCDLPQDE